METLQRTSRRTLIMDSVIPYPFYVFQLIHNIICPQYIISVSVHQAVQLRFASTFLCENSQKIPSFDKGTVLWYKNWIAVHKPLNSGP